MNVMTGDHVIDSL